MPAAQSPITSTPSVPGTNNYDATNENATGKWQSVDPMSGVCDSGWNVTGDWPDTDGWKQT